MDDHRQPEVARDLQLLAVEPLLPRGIEPRFDEVDADLADRDEARIVERGRHHRAQALHVGRLGAGEPERVDAEGVGEAVLPRDRGRLVALVDVPGRHHDHRHAGRPRARDDGVAVRVELVGIEVAVRVDPHGVRVYAARRARGAR